MDGIYNPEDGLFVGDPDTGEKLTLCLNSESLNCMMVSPEIAVVACDGGYMLYKNGKKKEEITEDDINMVRETINTCCWK